MRLALKGLAPEARYELTFADSGARQTSEGKELAEGLEVTIDRVPGSALITYRRLSPIGRDWRWTGRHRQSQGVSC